MLEHAPAVELPPDTRRVHSLERLGALLEVILCSGFPTQLLIIAVIRGFGIPAITPDGLLVPRFVILVSMLDSLLVIGLVVMLLRAHHESIRDVLIGRGRVLKEVVVGLALIPLVFIIVVMILGLVLHYFPYLRNVPTNPLEGLLKTRTDAVVFALVAMFAGGVREEVQRGFIIHRFDGFLGGGLAGVVTYSVLFGLGHFEQGWDATIATACLGAIWGLVYWRRRSIIAPMVSHAGFNLAQIIKAMLLR